MHHRFSCPLRWADLDLLGHVNNVRYADYLRAARDDLMRTAGVDLGSAGLGVRRHELTFLAPLMFGRVPVVVESWIRELDAGGAVLEHTIRHEGGRPALYLRARSTVEARGGDGVPRPFSDAELAALAPYLDTTAPAEPPVQAAVPVRVRSAEERRHPLQVRAGDLDVTGRVSDVSFVEYFQEARIAFFDRILRGDLTRGNLRWVVAQTDVDYLRPVGNGAPAYDCFTRLALVGHKSLTAEAVMRDEAGEDLATARAVLVVFDPATNRSAEPPAGYRELLAGLVEPD